MTRDQISKVAELLGENPAAGGWAERIISKLEKINSFSGYDYMGTPLSIRRCNGGWMVCDSESSVLDKNLMEFVYMSLPSSQGDDFRQRTIFPSLKDAFEASNNMDQKHMRAGAEIMRKELSQILDAGEYTIGIGQGKILVYLKGKATQQVRDVMPKYYWRYEFRESSLPWMPL